MNNEQEQQPSPEINSPFQNYIDYLTELGLFEFGGPEGPLSSENARLFLDSLTNDQRYKLAQLEAAYNQII